MSKILDKIDSPASLKGLTHAELQQLAAEIRELLIDIVSHTGGHLASSLGVVELTIALHRVFNSPEDKIIWDVGHQSYAHKLLTGRKERFTTLRQYNGISGFPVRAESPHDAFGAGHAGTSVSAALGMAIARDLKGDRYHVVAVTGDGALTAGMSFEAVNHVGQLGKKLIVVLNDNGMSISPSVGALAKLLNLVRLDYRYESAKKEAKKAILRLPMGDLAWKASKGLKNRLHRAILPGILWEELGFIYIGPVDGHSLIELEAALTRARDYETKPTLIHVLTRKGKGYSLAEDDACTYHGVPPQEAKANHVPSYSKVFGQTILRLMREDKKILAITAAMLDGTGLCMVAPEFPDRVIDVGICEQHAVTLAAGLATQGYLPIVAIYSTFLQRAYDQIIHDVCIQKLPVVFAIDRAGIVGDDGKTHQGAFDISYLNSIPNIIVSAPKDGNELEKLLVTAVKARQPMAVRYPRGNAPWVPSETGFRELSVGKAELLRKGDDIALVAIGNTVYPALEAAERLASQGVDCSVVNARFAKPLDADLILDLAARTGKILTIEENALRGGFGSAVLQLVQNAGLNRFKVWSIGLPDEFIEHGTQAQLRAKFGLDTQGIVKRVASCLAEVTDSSMRSER